MVVLTRFAGRLLLPAALGLALASCHFLEVGSPPTQVVSTNVYSTDASATAGILGIYVSLTAAGTETPGIFNDAALSTLLGLEADELMYPSPLYDAYRLNQVNPVGTGPSSLWNQAYASIYQCNAAVAGLTASTGLTPSLKTQLLGEAKFLRAFHYFYLASIFGDVPLLLTPDYAVNSTAARTARADVYAAVVTDLLDAQKLLSASYPVAGDRTRANQAAATALLARAYLYQQNWAGAETQASAVIAQSAVYTLPALKQVFLLSSPEAIWQLRRAGTVSSNTYEGSKFIPADTSQAPQNTFLLSNALDSSLGADPRRAAWTDTFAVAGTTYRYPYKYQQRVSTAGGGAATEASVALRLAEQYLIRAEARIRQGKVATGLADLNVVRARAQAVPLSTALSQANALLAVEQERRVELFAEYGHRWFDLIRTGRASAVLGPYKGTAWDPNHSVWPLPVSQLLANPKLVQNPGY